MHAKETKLKINKYNVDNRRIKIFLFYDPQNNEFLLNSHQGKNGQF